jgi:sugar phosphate isomerase/epimerase
MAGYPISLAAGNVQEFPPADMVSAAAAAGFDMTGIWVEPSEWRADTTREVCLRRDDAGMDVLDVEVIWIHPGQPTDDLKRIIDIGGEIGASYGLVVSSDADDEATRRVFADLCDHAQGAGLTLVLEFLPITAVRSLDQAVAIVTDAARPNGRVLIDTLHLARTGGTVDAVKLLDPALFPYLQIADAPLTAPGTDYDSLLYEAVDGRLLPGEGQLPIRELLEALPRGLALSPEIRSRALRDRYPDIADRARAIAEATRQFLTALH